MAGNHNSGRPHKPTLKPYHFDRIKKRFTNVIESLDLAFEQGTIKEKLEASEMVLSRLMPKLRSVEITGGEDVGFSSFREVIEFIANREQKISGILERNRDGGAELSDSDISAASEADSIP